MSESQVATLAAYRDGGFWTLVWQICSFGWKAGRLQSFPPRGFVGRGSLSSAAIGQRLARLKSIHLHRNRYTRNAPRWRLICEWETPLPARLPRKYGAFWGRFGKPLVDAGVGISVRDQTTITSKSSQFERHHYHP